MSNIERSIVSIVDPTIETDLIAMEDTGSKEAQEKPKSTPEGVNADDSARAGAIVPVITINTTSFRDDELIYMETDFSNSVSIPTIDVSIDDSKGNKFALEFPTDGDVISLYLRPPDTENLRPIRIDFDIVEIRSDSESMQYGISGVMKIPGFFAEKCESFADDTSFEQVKSICSNIGLGFASNVTSTDDSMPRLCAFDTYKEFVDKAVAYSYRDDDSFFTWYLDPYYYLCLVNINSQFDLEDTADQVNVSQSVPSGMDPNSTGAADTQQAALILTNQPGKEGNNMFITSYSLLQSTGTIWRKNGYKKYAQFFDINDSDEEYMSIFVDALTTEGSENDFILPKGRVGEDTYLDQNMYKWVGKQAPFSLDGNVHDNYLFAGILNFHNLEEIKKTSLKITIEGMNFYIYKYMKIPIAIYSMAQGKDSIDKLKGRDADLGESGNLDPADQPEGNLTSVKDGGSDPETLGVDPREGIKNEQLSGNYIVGGIKYIYTPAPEAEENEEGDPVPQEGGGMKMEIELIRREWPIPAQNKTL